MQRIIWAYSTILKREISIAEYTKIYKDNPISRVINSLRCVECGDEITFVPQQTYSAYFKHKPSSEGHDYCSLYERGIISQLPESKLRRSLFHDIDVSLNLEILYDGVWKYVITIPPFYKKDIETYNNGKVHISIKSNSGNYIIKDFFINSNTITPGKLQSFVLPKPYSILKIEINGTSNKRFSYTLEGFQFQYQIFSSLIGQEYVKKAEDEYIDLTRINSFSIKKISGIIYLGKHYTVFLNPTRLNYWLPVLKDAVEINCLHLNIPIDSNLNIYDIVFKSITKYTSLFCNERNCVLKEHMDAIPIWPPLNSIGNYRFAEWTYHKIYIAFFHRDNAKNRIVEIATNRQTMFRIASTYASPFYVFCCPYKGNTLPYYKSNLEIKDKISNCPNAYLYKNDVLIQKITNSSYIISSSDTILNYKTNTAWDIIKFETKKIPIPDTSVPSIWNNTFLNSVRYSLATEPISEEEMTLLMDRYRNNELVTNYLECFCSNGRIKTNVYKLLSGEKNGTK